MRQRFLPITFFLAVLAGITVATAQQYKAVTVDQLDARIAAGQDSVFVINFWATWCAPCIRELPYFDELQAAYARQPLKVLLVSVDAPSKAATSLSSFLKKRSVQSEVLHLNEAKPHEYIDRIAPEWSGSIPATLIRSPALDRRLFHEGEMTSEELKTLVKSIIDQP